MKKKIVLPLAVFAFTLASSFASAGDKAPLSSLPILPAPTLLKQTVPGVVGISATEQKNVGTNSPRYLEVKADTKSGYCIIGKDYGLRLASLTSYNPVEEELWRFTEDGEKKSATLERVAFDLPMGEMSVHTKSTKAKINLTKVGQSAQVMVWGFREANGDVTILARNATNGRETASRGEETGSLQFASSECSFGAARILSTQIKAGGVAQLRGNLPPVGEGKSKVTPRFTIDITVAKVGRDPEPLLSIRVRESDS